MQSRHRPTRLAVAGMAVFAALAMAAMPAAIADDAAKPVQSQTLSPITDALKSGALKAGDALDSVGDAIGRSTVRGLESAKEAGDWARDKSGVAARETVDGAKDAGRWSADQADKAYDATRSAVQDATSD